MDLISKLPEDCLTQILSRTSPKDVLRSLVVRTNFLSVSKSDAIWEKFLPSDYQQIISQSSSSIPQFETKRDLFLYLCRSYILINNNTQSFALDKWTGKKCYTLGPKALHIAWGDTLHYWSFEPITESRFAEVAELKYVWWLEVKGKIHAKLLSPNTNYGVYLVFKVLSDSRRTGSLAYAPVNVTVLEVDEEDEGPPRNNNQEMIIGNFYLEAAESEAEHIERMQEAPGELPLDRGDGWMELEMGRYQVGDLNWVSERAVLEMTLWDVDVTKIKERLVVQCIDLRPLD